MIFGIRKRIKAIKFAFLSPNEVRAMSATNIITADTYDDDGFPTPPCRACGRLLHKAIEIPEAEGMEEATEVAPEAPEAEGDDEMAIPVFREEERDGAQVRVCPHCAA